MKFSIIIPTLGRNKSLKRCLKAIQAQTYKDFEVIVIDQGDKQPDFPKFVTFAHSDVISAYHARNLGIQLAKGDVLLFIDDDVELFKDHLAALKSAFDAHPEMDGAFGYDVNYASRFNAFKRFFLLFYHGGPNTVLFSGHFTVTFSKVFRQIRVAGTNDFAVKKAAMAPFQHPFRGYSPAEDAMLSFRLSLAGKKLFAVPEARFIHRHSSGGRESISTQIQKRLTAPLITIFRLKDAGYEKVSYWAFAWAVIGDTIREIIHYTLKGKPLLALIGVLLSYLLVLRLIWFRIRHESYDSMLDEQGFLRVQPRGGPHGIKT